MSFQQKQNEITGTGPNNSIFPGQNVCFSNAQVFSFACLLNSWRSGHPQLNGYSSEAAQHADGERQDSALLTTISGTLGSSSVRRC